MARYSLEFSDNDIAIIKYALEQYQNECIEEEDTDTMIAIDMILNQFLNF